MHARRGGGYAEWHAQAGGLLSRSESLPDAHCLNARLVGTMRWQQMPGRPVGSLVWATSTRRALLAPLTMQRQFITMSMWWAQRTSAMV